MSLKLLANTSVAQLLRDAFGPDFNTEKVNKMDLAVAIRAHKGKVEHECYDLGDFTKAEIAMAEMTQCGLAYVILTGMQICKHCGAIESELIKSTCTTHRLLRNKEIS